VQRKGGEGKGKEGGLSGFGFSLLYPLLPQSVVVPIGERRKGNPKEGRKRKKKKERKKKKKKNTAQARSGAVTAPELCSLELP